MRDYVNDNNREWGGGLDMNINQIQNQNMIEIGAYQRNLAMPTIIC